MLYFLLGVLTGATFTAIGAIFWHWTRDDSDYFAGFIHGLHDSEARAAGFASASEYLEDQLNRALRGD